MKQWSSVVPKIIYSKSCFYKQCGHCCSCLGDVGVGVRKEEEKGEGFSSSTQYSLSCFI